MKVLVNILERQEDGQVKVHYVGYTNKHDEWKDEYDLGDMGEKRPEFATCGV